MFLLVFKPRNPEVYQAVMKFVKKATDFLNKLLVNGKKVPLTIKEEPIIDELGYHGERYAETPAYFRFIRDHEDELKELRNFVTGVETVSRNVLVQDYYQGKISDSSGRIIENPNIKPFVGVQFFISPLITLIERMQSLKFNEKVFNQLYQNLEERLLYEGERIYHYYAPLFNFDSEQERELGRNIVIRRIRPSMLKRIWQLERFTGIIPLFKLHEIQYVIEMPYKHPKDQAINHGIPRKNIERVVSALRLFKKGVPGFNILYHGTGASMPGFAPRDFYGKRYVLETKEIEEFQLFWKFFKKMMDKKKRFLDISIRRFNKGLDDHFPEDKLIDFIIALEALYLPEMGELSYRLGLRSSILLAEEGKEKEIRELLKETYDVRSKIVHGKKVKSIKVQEQIIKLQDLVAKIEDLTRKSIVAFLRLINLTGNHEDIIDSLERSITDQSLREKIKGQIR